MHKNYSSRTFSDEFEKKQDSENGCKDQEETTNIRQSLKACDLVKNFKLFTEKKITLF